MRLDEYQELAHVTARSDDLDVYVLGLVGETASVATAVKKRKRDGPLPSVVKEQVADELGDVLWYLSELATRFDLKISDIANRNLKKAKFLFSATDAFYDNEAPLDQQLPRNFVAMFEDDGKHVTMKIDGHDCGDRLDDNVYEDDGYRFHDVFHCAYAVHLGWSPVLRNLMKRKRKYDPLIDRIEDGARSRFLEEGLSVMIFNQNTDSEGQSMFAQIDRIPDQMLLSIKEMTRTIEVSSRDYTAWARAIEDGFKMFDLLRQHGGGRVQCDLTQKTMTFEPL